LGELVFAGARSGRIESDRVPPKPRLPAARGFGGAGLTGPIADGFAHGRTEVRPYVFRSRPASHALLHCRPPAASRQLPVSSFQFPVSRFPGPLCLAFLLEEGVGGGQPVAPSVLTP